MKKGLLSSLWSFLAIAGAAFLPARGPAQDIARLDRERGFIGVQLGSPIEDFSDADVVSESDVDAWYVRQQQRLEWGGLKLRQVRYRVVEGRIAAIQLLPASDKDSVALFAVLAKAYGPTKVYEQKDGMKSANWTGRTVRLAWLHFPSRSNFGAEFIDVELDKLATRKALQRARGE